MKQYLFDSSGIEIPKEKIPVFLFDFDLTLSPLVPIPEDAIIPPSTKELLRKISQKAIVGIVSGRDLAFLVPRIDLQDITFYGGNHGMEWMFHGERECITLPEGLFLEVLGGFHELASQYPGTIVENKGLSVCFHYRKIIDDTTKKELESALNQIPLNPLLRKRWEEGMLEVLPIGNHTKGTLCEQISKELGNPCQHWYFYVGDSATDEDAFRYVNSIAGMSIRVGYSEHSAANYYIHEQSEIDTVLEQIHVRLCNYFES